MTFGRSDLQNRGRREGGDSTSQQMPGITTIVGTAFLRLAEYPALLPKGQIVVVDVPNEVDTLRLRRFLDRDVHIVRVGFNRTLQAIVGASGREAQQSALKKLPVINSSDGLAQLRAVGGAASRELVGRREFRRLLKEQLLPELHRMAGGELPAIRLVHLQGTAGGMASRGGIEIYDAFVEACLEESDVVETDVHLLGAVTFNSREFKRTRENSSPALVEWLDKVRHPLSERVSLSLVCHEVYPVGKDKRLRDSLVIDQLQALSAPATAQALRRTKSNKGADGPFGSARLVRSDHFKSLSTREIGADVARAYLPFLSDVLKCGADLGLVKRFRWRGESRRVPRDGVDDILGRALTSEPEELIESLTRRGAQLASKPSLQLRDGTLLRLSDIGATFSSRLASAGQARRRVTLFETCEAACLDQMDDLEELLDTLRDDAEQLERKVTRAVVQLQGSRWSSMFVSDEAKIAAAAESFEQLRNNADLQAVAEEKLDALNRVVAQVRRERTNLTQKLNSLARLMNRCVPHGDERKSSPIIEPQSIDDVFGELLGLVEQPDSTVDATLHLLSQVVKTVTPEGLAKIVGAPDATVEAIVRAVVDGHGSTRGPAWGGLVREDQPDRFIVYPPVEANFARRLRAHHQLLNDGSTPVAFARTALGSVNVVVLEVLNARDQSDVLVPFYLKGLDRALNSEIADLYIEDRDALTRLGLLNPEPPNE